MFNFFKKSKSEEVTKVDQEEWMKKVYNVVSKVNLWSSKLSYSDYLKSIEKYSKRFSTLPSEEDLTNPASFTRGIFVAIDKNILYGGGFDYEYGYEALFETLENLFKKAKISFSWKMENDSLYTYEVDGSKYKLNLSENEEADIYEVDPDAFVELESNINKALQKQNLCLVHTYTGDQTIDYVLVSKENFQKLKEILPNAEDYQVTIDGKVQNL